MHFASGFPFGARYLTERVGSGNRNRLFCEILRRLALTRRRPSSWWSSFGGVGTRSARAAVTKGWRRCEIARGTKTGGSSDAAAAASGSSVSASDQSSRTPVFRSASGATHSTRVFVEEGCQCASDQPGYKSALFLMTASASPWGAYDGVGRGVSGGHKTVRHSARQYVDGKNGEVHSNTG